MTPYEQHLVGLAEGDPRIVVLTAENRAAIRNLPACLGERFIDVGICEQALVGTAAGLAACGRRPIVHALAAFLTMRAFEFIRTDLGIARLPVTLVGGVPGLLSDGNGPTHQAIEDIALMRGVPNMVVAAPADGSELLDAISAAQQHVGPTYVRYFDGSAQTVHGIPYAFGKAEIHGDIGTTVCILCYGFLVAQAFRAQRELKEAGVGCCVVNMRTVSPLDEEVVLSCARRAKLLAIAEDHFERGGLFTAVAETIARTDVSCSLLPMNLGGNWFRAGELAEVLKKTGLSGERLAARILSRLEINDEERSRTNTNLPLHQPL